MTLASPPRPDRPRTPRLAGLLGLALVALPWGCSGRAVEPAASAPAERPEGPGPRPRPERHGVAPPEEAGRVGAAKHEPGHGAHRAGHFSDPLHFEPAWNAPDRDAWQKPEEIVAALRLEAGETVVDLGAGTGYLIPKLAEAVGPKGTVIAVEPEPAMLEYLEKAAAREGWKNVRTHASSYDDPKLPPASADAIVALNVWHHVDKRGAFAKKVAAALEPGGVFAVVDFLKEKTEGFGPPLAMRLSAEQVEAELEEGGLSASVLKETLPRHYIVVGVRPE